MTPFGRKLRLLRRERGITMKAMAAAIGVSPAYLSALEHGRRGAPTWSLVQRIIQFFNVIWDDAEELAQLAQSSDPRVKVETAGLSAKPLSWPICWPAASARLISKPSPPCSIC